MLEVCRVHHPYLTARARPEIERHLRAVWGERRHGEGPVSDLRELLAFHVEHPQMISDN